MAAALAEAAAKLEEQEQEIVELKQRLQRLDTSMRLDPSHLLQASQERVMRASRELEAANVRHAFFSFYAPTKLGAVPVYFKVHKRLFLLSCDAINLN